jgi:hypothetical protein
MKLNALVYTVAVGLLASSMMPIMICHAASDKPATRAETKQGGDKGGDKAMGGAMKLQAENAISQQQQEDYWRSRGGSSRDEKRLAGAGREEN